jgi:hypothetical protein
MRTRLVYLDRGKFYRTFKHLMTRPTPKASPH